MAERKSHPSPNSLHCSSTLFISLAHKNISLKEGRTKDGTEGKAETYSMKKLKLILTGFPKDEKIKETESRPKANCCDPT